MAFKCETGAAHAPAAAGGVAGAKGGVKSEQGAGVAVSQDVMRPRVLELRVSKTSADLYVQEFGKNFKLNTVIFRCGCITGENHSGSEAHGFLNYLIKNIIEKY